jgi:hypothetical protein
MISNETELFLMESLSEAERTQSRMVAVFLSRWIWTLPSA